MTCAIGTNASTVKNIVSHESAVIDLKGLELATPRTQAVLNFVHIPKSGGSSLEQCLARFCASNKLKCHQTFHHSRYSGDWLGKRMNVANNLDQLRNMTSAKRNMIDIVYGHQESGIQELIERPVQNIAIIRNPLDRWVSEVSYLKRHTPLGDHVLPRECLPHEESAAYLCYGSDFRKAEIYRQSQNESFYAKRRVPTVKQLMLCLKKYILVSRIDLDSKFIAVGRVLKWRFPNSQTPFACNERRNVSPLSHTKQLMHTMDTPEAQRLNPIDAALWETCNTSLKCCSVCNRRQGGFF